MTRRSVDLVIKPPVISEKKHLLSALVSNGNPLSSCRSSPKQEKHAPLPPPGKCPRQSLSPRWFCHTSREYHCLQQQGIRAVFKFNTILRSHKCDRKTPSIPANQDGVVYRIPCKCGEVYIGETGRSMQEKVREHDRVIRLARTQTSRRFRTCQ